MRLRFTNGFAKRIGEDRASRFSHDVNRGREVAGTDPATKHSRNVWFWVGYEGGWHGVDGSKVIVNSSVSLPHVELLVGPISANLEDAPGNVGGCLTKVQDSGVRRSLLVTGSFRVQAPDYSADCE